MFDRTNRSMGSAQNFGPGLSMAAAVVTSFSLLSFAGAEPAPLNPFQSSLHAESLESHLKVSASGYDSLMRLPKESPTTVVVPGLESKTLVLQRFELFSPTARVVVGTKDGDRTMADPEIVFLRGGVAGKPGSRVFLAVTPDSANGLVRWDDQTRVISSDPLDADAGIGVFDPTTSKASRLALAGAGCGALPIQSPHARAIEALIEQAAANPTETLRLAASCRLVDIAVETDYEFTSESFGGDTVASAAYAATLLAAVSTIYQTEVGVQLRVSYLRVWDQNIDPYETNSAIELLYALREHWNTNMRHVHRNVTHLLSSRALDGAGGVAWLNALCESRESGYGYGLSGYLSGMFPRPLQSYDPQNWDVVVVAHELGHNFGALHTHQMTPPVDRCGLNLADRCADAHLGSIMSYCHSCTNGMANIGLSLHPRVVQERILPYLATMPCELATGAPRCDGDADGDGTVTFSDITSVLMHFGNVYEAGSLELGDSDGNSVVNFGDISTTLLHWGTRCDDLPAQPRSLVAAQVAARSASLAWFDASCNETGFEVLQSVDGSYFQVVQTLGPNSEAAELTGLTPATRYWLAVRATGPSGHSVYSNIVQITTDPDQPPAAPSGLRAENVWARTVDLAWTDTSSNETEFRVAMSTTGPNGSFDNIGTVAANTTLFRVENLTPGVCYWFKVRAANAAGYSGYSQSIQACTPNEVPAAPTNLLAPNVWARQLDLVWTDNSSNETEFRIAMSTTGPNGSFNNIGATAANTTSFRVQNLTPATCYWFKVRSGNAAGYSSYTQAVQVCTPDEVPLTPSGLLVTGVSPCSIQVAWTDNAANESEYRVAVSTTGETGNYTNVATLPANSTGLTIPDLCPQTTYWIKIRAGNSAGFSEYSNTVTAQTQPLRTPMNLVAARDDLTPQLDVVVTWTNPSGCYDGILIARSTDQVNWNNIGTVGAGVSNFRDASGLQSGRTYYYKVRAYKDCGGVRYYSGYSAVDSAIPR